MRTLQQLAPWMLIAAFGPAPALLGQSEESASELRIGIGADAPGVRQASAELPEAGDVQVQQAAPVVAPRPVAARPMATQPLTNLQVTNQTRQALGFYGGYAARATLSQMPRRTPIRPNLQQDGRARAKPFSTVYRDPTVSPYLNLYRDEADSEGAPNYFAFVRPQQDQIEANRAQQRQLQQLAREMQNAASTAYGGVYRARMPGTGTAARYMDTAQFYSGLPR